MHRVADLVADYLEGVGDRPVLPAVSPGDVRRVLPAAAPEEAESIETILDDYLRVIEPNITHWNHPGFLAYFGITGSGPGILGETLAAALNNNAMLWRTGPAPDRARRAGLRLARADDGASPGLCAATSTTPPRPAPWWPWPPPAHRMPGLDVRAKGLSGRAAADRLLQRPGPLVGRQGRHRARPGHGQRPPHRERRRLPHVRPRARRGRGPRPRRRAPAHGGRRHRGYHLDHQHRPRSRDRGPLRPRGDLAPRGRRLCRRGRHLPRVPGPHAGDRAGGFAGVQSPQVAVHPGRLLPPLRSRPRPAQGRLLAGARVPAHAARPPR